jgi:hypothetical protein
MKVLKDALHQYRSLTQYGQQVRTWVLLSSLFCGLLKFVAG